MFKHEQFSHAHLASGRAVVILEHVYYGLPQEFYIFIGKLSRLLRQSRGYISLRAIKACLLYTSHAVFSSPFVLILQHFRKKNSLNDGAKANML